MTTETFDVALASFLETLTTRLQTNFAARHPILAPKFVEVDNSSARRYVRIWDGYGDHRSCFAFVDKTNGDVLKPESWKKPAKHARGNIFSDQNGMEAIDAGDNVRYLR